MLKRTYPVCQFEAVFPELPGDHEACTWRDGKYSDWLLRCGSETYTVHKIVVATGPRASRFLRAAISDKYAPKAETDVSQVLPRACWSVLHRVLDYIYEETTENTKPEGLLSLFVAADILQVKPLFDITLATINNLFKIDSTGESILAFFHEASALHGCHPVIAKIVEEAQAFIRLNFAMLWESLHLRPLLLGQSLPDDVPFHLGLFQAILDSDNLDVESEDQVLSMIIGLQAKGERKDAGGMGEDAPDLWQTCRFAHLSVDRRLEVLSLPAVPSKVVALSSCLYEIHKAGGDVEKRLRDQGEEEQRWVKRHRVLPRGSQIAWVANGTGITGHVTDHVGSAGVFNTSSVHNGYVVIDDRSDAAGQITWRFKIDEDNGERPRVCIGVTEKPIHGHHNKHTSFIVLKLATGRVERTGPGVVADAMIRPADATIPGLEVHVTVDYSSKTVSFMVGSFGPQIFYRGVEGPVFPADRKSVV